MSARDIVIKVSSTVTEEVDKGVTIKELSLLTPTPNQPGVFAIGLAPKDASGNWDAADPIVQRWVDAPQSENPQEQYAASGFIDLMFNAIVDHLHPVAQAYAIPEGTTLKEAGKMILGGILMPAGEGNHA